MGVEPVIVPIRGGTDGARLSWERDIPCPNLCTGGANYHGVHEFVPVASMEKMVQVLVELVKTLLRRRFSGDYFSFDQHPAGDAADVLLGQLMEHDDLIDTVQELGTERSGAAPPSRRP